MNNVINFSNIKRSINENREFEKYKDNALNNISELPQEEKIAYLESQITVLAQCLWDLTNRLEQLEGKK